MRLGVDGRVPTIVVDVVPSTSRADHVHATPRVLGHEYSSTTTEPLGECDMISLLRQIGDARICPGVGEKDMTPSARPGWAELTQRAAREYSNPLLSGSLTGIDLERARESHVIGQRIGGVLENITGALRVPPGVRFRSESCSLVESGEEKWVEPRGEGRIATCSACRGFLYSIVKAAEAEKAKKELPMPHIFTNHRHIVRDGQERQLAAFAAAARRTVAANLAKRRARADAMQLRESLSPPCWP